jgi:hypothetical protein
MRQRDRRKDARLVRLPLGGISIELPSLATRYRASESEVSAPRRPFRPLGTRRGGVSLSESSCYLLGSIYITLCRE